MRQILCAMMSPNDQIVREIHRFGRDHDWQVELCGGRIPPGWSGDGVLTDGLPLEELKKIRNFECTPVVSHTLTPGGNVRTVAGEAYSPGLPNSFRKCRVPSHSSSPTAVT